MKRINFRLLSAVLLSVLLGAVALAAIHRLQSRRTAGFFLENALAAKAEGDLEESLRSFDRYLSLVPDDAQALAEYGLALAEAARRDRPDRRALGLQAYDALDRCLQNQAEWPDAALEQDVRRSLAEMAIAIGRFPEAQQQLERHLLPHWPEDADLHYLLAQCRIGLRQHAAAAESLQAAVERKPGMLEAYLQLVELFRGPLEQPDAAASWIDKMVESNTDSPQARLHRARYCLRTKDAARAAEDIAYALKLQPENIDALTLAAQLAMDGRDYAAAKRHAEQALSHEPRLPRMHLLLADVAWLSGDPQEAVARLRTGLERLPGDPELLQDLAEKLIDSGRLDETQELLTSFQGIEALDAAANYFQARIALAQGKWQAACDGLQQALSGLAQRPRLRRDAAYFLGQAQARMGDVEASIAAYQRSLRIDPSFDPARRDLALTLASQGRLPEAIDVSADAVLLLAQTCMIDENWSEARRTLWALVERNEKDARCIAAYIECCLRQEDLSEAEAWAHRLPDGDLAIAGGLARLGRIDEAMKRAVASPKKPSSPAIADFVGSVVASGKATTDQLQRLQSFFDAAMQGRKQDVPLLMASAGLLAARERFDDVERAYREILKQDEKNVVALNDLAVLLALRGKQLEEAQRLIQLAMETAGRNPVLLDSRATVLLARGKAAEALVDLAEAIAANPRPVYFFHQALAYREQGQHPEAARAWKEALARGLQQSSLHPLERTQFERLQAAVQ